MMSIDADAGGTVAMTPGTGPVLPQDMIDAATADAILRLDRKMARAIQTDRGINLKSEDLDLLTLVGAVNLLGKARSEIQGKSAVPAPKVLYRRGEFHLDHLRGKDGEVVSPNLYICWYDPVSGRMQRRSTRTDDVRLAIQALDRHYLACHQPADDDKASYTVHQAMIDY